MQLRSERSIKVVYYMAEQALGAKLHVTVGMKTSKYFNRLQTKEISKHLWNA